MHNKSPDRIYIDEQKAGATDREGKSFKVNRDS